MFSLTVHNCIPTFGILNPAVASKKFALLKKGMLNPTAAKELLRKKSLLLIDIK
jgi:hypothetical protein